MDSLAAIVGPLLEWYGRNARSLPWREEPAPYRVWVSEIMLQQTRVEAVKPYFARFLAELPDVTALASAPEQQLMKLWEGLGYYSRARNLQKAARVMVEQYGGTLPADYDALLKLPGIGPYTAGAVASIAYGIPVPAVDGNVLRVVMRLTAGWEDIADPAVKRAVERRMAAILPKDRPGDFNQAMMELGATVCAPGGEPKCLVCPLNALCEGYRQGVARELPVKAKKKARRIEERTVFLLVCDGELAIRKRADSGLLAGLWELPSVEGKLNPEGARADGFRLGRIWTCVFFPVSSVYLPCVFPVQPGQICRRDHKKSSKPCRNIIKNIIHSGRNASEVQISVILISQHGIHCIDCLIEESQRRAADHQINQRRCHTVGSIFRHRLHRRFGYALLCQALRIPSYNHGNSPAGSGQIILLKPVIYFSALPAQAPGCQNLKTPEGLQRKTKSRMNFPCQQKNPQGKQKRQSGNHQPENRSCSRQMLFSGYPAQEPLSQLDPFSDYPDRMIDPCRVSEDKV